MHAKNEEGSRPPTPHTEDTSSERETLLQSSQHLTETTSISTPGHLGTGHDRSVHPSLPNPVDGLHGTHSRPEVPPGAASRSYWDAVRQPPFAPGPLTSPPIFSPPRDVSGGIQSLARPLTAHPLSSSSSFRDRAPTAPQSLPGRHVYSPPGYFGRDLSASESLPRPLDGWPTDDSIRQILGLRHPLLQPSANNAANSVTSNLQPLPRPISSLLSDESTGPILGVRNPLPQTSPSDAAAAVTATRESMPRPITSSSTDESIRQDLGLGPPLPQPSTDNTATFAPSAPTAPTALWNSGQDSLAATGSQGAEEQDLVPDDTDDNDSAMGSDADSTTTSLSQSIYNYRMEHGRTYHAYKDGKYIFPNDEREADRLDLQHHLFRLTFANRLFFSPLKDPKNCLDVGTGTGIWAIEFADEFPGCQVVGIDLSPGQPSLVPPNLKFIIDDAEDLWVYEQQFDFIHLRLMAGSFADWPRVIQQAYDNLEPGGWLELQDYGLPVKSADGTHEGTDVHKWGELLCEAARKLGRPLGSDASDRYVSWMEQAGFTETQTRMFMWPTNGWPKDPLMKELGRWNQINILDGLEGFCLALLTRALGWSKTEVDVFVARVGRDLRDRRIHTYFPMPVVFGRKPLV